MMMWPNMMSGFWGGFGTIWMILNFIFFALIIAGIVILIVWIVKRISLTEPKELKKEGAIEILKERYAKGELTKKEFEDMKKDLI